MHLPPAFLVATLLQTPNTWRNPMRIKVTFRHLDQSDELRQYAENRLQKLKKYSDGPMDVNVVLSTEKFRHSAEVVISGDGIRAAAKEEQEDMKAAIDLVSDKIERQLKKYRDKLISRRNAASHAQPAPAEAVASEPEADEIITVEKMNSKPMIVDEAVDQLQILGRQFLPFRNAETNEINVVYWRNDGTLGLIEP